MIEQYNEMVSRANCRVFMISVGDTPVEESGGSNPFLEPDFDEPLDEFLAHLFVFRTSLPVPSERLQRPCSLGGLPRQAPCSGDRFSGVGQSARWGRP